MQIILLLSEALHYLQLKTGFRGVIGSLTKGLLLFPHHIFIIDRTDLLGDGLCLGAHYWPLENAPSFLFYFI